MIPTDDFNKEYDEYQLECQKFAHHQQMDEEKQQLEYKSRRWAQIATFVPIIILIGGFYLNSMAERSKDIRIHDDDSRKQRIALRNKYIEFIEKQLNEFYYPIRLGMDKYVILNQQVADKKNSTVNGKWARQIEQDALIPNHKKIIGVIDSKFYLIKNSFGDGDVEPLVELIKKYQLHVASYGALRETKDDRNPVDVYADYPEGLNQTITDRIQALLTQQQALQDENRQEADYK